MRPSHLARRYERMFCSDDNHCHHHHHHQHHHYSSSSPHEAGARLPRMHARAHEHVALGRKHMRQMLQIHIAVGTKTHTLARFVECGYMSGERGGSVAAAAPSTEVTVSASHARPCTLVQSVSRWK
jgi:hypothetical protein